MTAGRKMKRSHRVLINILVFIVLCVAGFLVYRSFTDTGEGKKLLSAAVEDRVSVKFSEKSVREDTGSQVSFGTEGYESGSANIVTSIVVNYRAFDTLLEVIILFASTAGIAMLMEKRKRRIYTESSQIVKTAVPVINLFIYVVGIVIILRGHLSPGGGFAGGAVLASAFILTSLAFRNTGRGILYMVLETLMGLGILAVGLLGIYYGGGFLQNFLPTGRVGDFFSGGTVVILYTLIGVKVLSEISGISGSFLGNLKEKR